MGLEIIFAPLLVDVTELAYKFGELKQSLEADDPFALYTALQEIRDQSDKMVKWMTKALVTDANAESMN